MGRVVIGLVVLMLVSPAWAGSLSIVLPDAKDAKAVEARDHYNTRTGQSLTTLEWAKQVLYGCGAASTNPAGQPYPVGAAAELTMKRDEAAAAVFQTEAGSAKTDKDAENAGWEE